MLQSYLCLINHNRYLKIQYKNTYCYSKLFDIKLQICFKNTNNNKFNLLCVFFLFKTIVFKNGYYIILNKKTRKIIGIKFSLQHQIMFNFIKFLIQNFINQPEIQNNIKLTSFDKNNNYILNINNNSYYYYLDKLIKNKNYKTVLSNLNLIVIFSFKNNNSLLDHIFYLNCFKLYFYNTK